MTTQAKIKTVNATPVLKFKKDTVKNIMEAKENFDQNEIAKKASTSFLTALGSPRNALVALNTMFQAIAITRGTQPIVNALNKANAKGNTKEASLLRWNQLILKNLNTVTIDKDNGGKTTVRTKDLKELISFDPSNDPVIKSVTLEQKQKLAQNWISSKAEAWNMTEAEVKD